MKNLFEKWLLNSKLWLQLSFYKETYLVNLLSSLVISYAFCQCHDKVANLLTSVLRELT